MLRKRKPQNVVSLFAKTVFDRTLGKDFPMRQFEHPDSAAQHHDLQVVDELGCDYHANVTALYVLLQFPMSPEPTNIL
jgi:hypothetical protein